MSEESFTMAERKIAEMVEMFGPVLISRPRAFYFVDANGDYHIMNADQLEVIRKRNELDARMNVERIAVQPGDVIVATYPESVKLSMAQEVDVIAMLKNAFPDNKVMLLHGGVKLSVMAQAEHANWFNTTVEQPKQVRSSEEAKAVIAAAPDGKIESLSDPLAILVDKWCAMIAKSKQHAADGKMMADDGPYDFSFEKESARADPEATRKCNCPMSVITSSGCKCGGV